MGIKHVKVSTIADSATTVDVSPTEWNADHSITGPVILSSGTATNAPLLFVAGELNTTSTAGGVEYDGNCFYNTAIDATRQVNVSMQFMHQTTSRTLTTSTLHQKLLNETTNGAVTVGAGTYFYDGGYALTFGSSLAKTVGFSLGGTATLTRVLSLAQSRGAIAHGTPTQASLSVKVTTASSQLHSGSTGVTAAGTLTGKLVVTAGGTVIPQIQVTANNATAAVLDDAFFRIWSIGSSAVGTVGNWS
jgi:hypothetical protein